MNKLPIWTAISSNKGTKKTISRVKAINTNPNKNGRLSCNYGLISKNANPSS